MRQQQLFSGSSEEPAGRTADQLAEWLSQELGDPEQAGLLPVPAVEFPGFEPADAHVEPTSLGIGLPGDFGKEFAIMTDDCVEPETLGFCRCDQKTHFGYWPGDTAVQGHQRCHFPKYGEDVTGYIPGPIELEQQSLQRQIGGCGALYDLERMTPQVAGQLIGAEDQVFEPALTGSVCWPVTEQIDFARCIRASPFAG